MSRNDLAVVLPQSDGSAALMWPPSLVWGKPGIQHLVISKHVDVQGAFAWAVRRGMRPQLRRTK